jgi:hypothetical protein
MMNHLTSKIALAIYVLCLLALGSWGYPIVKQRYFPDSQSTSKTSTDQAAQVSTLQQADATSPSTNTADDSQDQENSASDTSDSNSEGADSSAPIEINEKNASDDSGSELAHITTEHCDDDCDAFANDLSLLEYCQQVCGIVSTKNISSCDDKKDIEKDYCLKDLAITKSDPSTCEQIKDVNIRQACKNRITEDIIEKQ